MEPKPCLLRTRYPAKAGSNTKIHSTERPAGAPIPGPLVLAWLNARVADHFRKTLLPAAHVPYSLYGPQTPRESSWGQASGYSSPGIKYPSMIPGNSWSATDLRFGVLQVGFRFWFWRPTTIRTLVTGSPST